MLNHDRGSYYSVIGTSGGAHIQLIAIARTMNCCIYRGSAGGDSSYCISFEEYAAVF